jgi:predicted 2-oxoglutarate/Fe(II)-dependent dioxygenase YbiX
MMDGQKFLKEHKDGSEFSFILSLNNNYKGGGTKLHYIDKVVKLNTGDILLFSGQQIHSGESIISGERWIVTGFLSFKSQNYCLNYINNRY